MAKPPSSFAPEPGGSGPCGHSWYRGLRVDGKIPGRDFGSQFFVNLPPVATTPLPSFGLRSEEEADLLRSIGSQIDSLVRGLHRLKVAEDAGGDPDFLTDKHEGAIRWLLAGAQAALDGATSIYQLWEQRHGLPFPLEAPDTAAGFHEACYGKEQYAPINIPDESPRADETVNCPGATTYQQRRDDRARIGKLVVDAMHHLRCAQWRYHRLRLHAQAVAHYEPGPGEGFGLGQATEQPWVGEQPTQAGVVGDLGQFLPGAPPMGSRDFAPTPEGPVTPGGFAPTPLPEIDPDDLGDPDGAAEPEGLGGLDPIEGASGFVRGLPTWAKAVGGLGLLTVIGLWISD